MLKVDWLGIWWESVAAGLQESLIRRVRIRGPRPFSVQKDLVYARTEGHNLKADLFLPKNLTCETPILVAIHGGAWSMGSKAGMSWVGWLMASRGWAVLCPNYRLAPRFKFPAPCEDLKRCLQWLNKSGSEWGLKGHYVCAFGVSAGAHLALLLALKEEPSPFQKVVAIFPPTDLTASYYVEAARHPPPLIPNYLKDFLGGTYEELPEVWRAASPIYFVHRQAPPCFLIHGTKDRLVPVDQSIRFANALTSAGGSVRLRIIEGLGHGVAVRPRLLNQLRSALNEALGFLEPQGRLSPARSPAEP